MWKYRTQTQQNASQPIVLSLKTLHHQKWWLPCCLPLACPLSGCFWDLLTSPSHTWMKRLNLREHGLSLDFSRLLVRFKIFLAWSWAQFQLENSCTILLRQSQGSIKSYSQNLWGEQHNFGREIHPAGTITLLPQPHLPFCLLQFRGWNRNKTASHLSYTCFWWGWGAHAGERALQRALDLAQSLVSPEMQWWKRL